MILKAIKTIENELDILEVSSLLVDLRNSLKERHPEENEEVLKWALEQSIMRLSLKTGHSFEEGV